MRKERSDTVRVFINIKGNKRNGNKKQKKTFEGIKILTNSVIKTLKMEAGRRGKLE